MLYRHAVRLSLLFAVGACSPGRQSDDLAAARSALDSLNARIEGWYAAGNSDSIAALYTPDAVIFLPNAPPVVGRHSITDHWRRTFSGFEWKVALETQSVVAAGTVAVQHGRYTIVMTREGAADPLATDRGHYLLTWVQTPAGWRVRYDISLSELPREAR